MQAGRARPLASITPMMWWLTGRGEGTIVVDRDNHRLRKIVRVFLLQGYYNAITRLIQG
jgi:hypothetical protein